MGEPNCVEADGITLDADKDGQAVLKVSGQVFSLGKSGLARLVREALIARPLVTVCYEGPYVLHLQAFCLEEGPLQGVDADGGFHMAIACPDMRTADTCLNVLREELDRVAWWAENDEFLPLEFSINPLAVPEDDFDRDEFVNVDSPDGALFALRHFLAFDMHEVAPEGYWESLGINYKKAQDEFDWAADAEFSVVEDPVEVAQAVTVT